MGFFYKIIVCIMVSTFALTAATGQLMIKQEPHPYSRQFGFSFKATLEAGTKNQPNPIVRFAAAAGIGSNLISRDLYASLNVEALLYNGGMGSRNTSQFFDFDLDFITALTLTAGTDNHFKSTTAQELENRNIPLYYFSDFTNPPLQNPFQHSLSIGTNLIFPAFDKYKKKQRIGFINGHIGRMQLSYYNDGGTPVNETYLGDRRDRYYTGGGVVSYHGNRTDEVNLIEVSYHKYTGYTKNAFEASNKLFLGYINYKQTEQQGYNKSVLNLNITSLKRGLGMHLRAYNHVRLDVQHLIHWGLYQAYHMVPYQSHIAIGLNYYYTRPTIGLQ